MGFTLTQGVAAVTVYWQTMLENQNAYTYFSLMRPAKLLGLSHAHLFGYTVLFGLTGLMVCCTRLSAYIKGVLTCGMVLSAFADVGSWWLMKYFGPAFEVVTYGAGALFAGCFGISLLFILKTIFGSWRKQPRNSDGLRLFSVEWLWGGPCGDWILMPHNLTV